MRYLSSELHVHAALMINIFISTVHDPDVGKGYIDHMADVWGHIHVGHMTLVYAFIYICRSHDPGLWDHIHISHMTLMYESHDPDVPV